MQKKFFIITFLLFLFVSEVYSQEAHYELDISGYVGRTRSSCGSRSNGLQYIHLQYENGFLDDRYFSPGRYRNRPIITNTVKFNESNKIKQINFHTNFRRRKRGNCQSRYRRWFQVELINNSTCVNYTFDFKTHNTFSSLGNARIKRGSEASDVEGQAKIVIKPVVRLANPGVNNNFGSEGYLTIPAIRGINNRYFNWEYAFSATGPYRPLPNYTSQKNFLRVKGKDFLDPVRDHGKTIFFRVNTGCQGSVSNTISYRFFRDAPRITNNATNNSGITECYDSKDGEVRLFFDRRLGPSESLSISSTNGNFPGDYDNLKWHNFRLSDNSILIKGLAPGKYPIELVGFFRGANTYVESTKHKIEIEIKRPKPVEFSFSSSDILCYGGKDGSIKITASGGKEGKKYKYLLRKAGDRSPVYRSDWVSFASARNPTHYIRRLDVGEYTLKVKDFNDCIAKDIRRSGGRIVGLGREKEVRIKIKQPKKPLNIKIVHKKNPLGFGFSDGEITAHITGGTPDSKGEYDILWIYEKNGVTRNWNRINVKQEIVPGEEGAFVTLTNGIDGNYSIRVRDDNYGRASNRLGCVLRRDKIELVEPPKLSIQLDRTNPISCNPSNIHGNSANDGELTVTANGGIPFSPLLDGKYAYDYTWKRKDFFGNYEVIRGEKGRILKNLEEGEYAVNIKDANGITVGVYEKNILRRATDATYDLVAPPLLDLSYTKQDVFCYKGTDGSIDLTIKGGTGAYTILWSNNETTEDISQLTAGTYQVKVVDEKGCEAEATIEIEEPNAPLKISYQFFEPTFAGATNGWIEATITGGTPLNSNEYTFVWKDANGHNLNNKVTSSATTASHIIRLNGIGEGNYKLTVQDKNYPLAIDLSNCTITESEYFLNEPEPLVADVTIKTPISCNRNNVGNPFSDGELEIKVTGGVRLQPNENAGLSYYYTWKKETAPGVWTVLPTQTSNIATGLDQGNYAVNIKDANGIVIGEYQNNALVKAKDLLQEIREPEVIEVSFKKQDVFCYEGSDGWAEVFIKGGTPPYHIEWNTGSTVSRINNLIKGQYTVTITDTRGCEVVENIEINQPENEITIDFIEFSTPKKGGESTGWILAEIDGGTTFADGSYTYYWQNEKGEIINAQTTTNVRNGKFQIRLNNIPKDTYVLTIEDANYQKATTKKGCTYIEKEFILYDPVEAVITIDTPISCNQNNVFNNPFSDGILQVEVTGGLPFETGNPYTYFWKKENSAGVYEDLNINSNRITNLSHGSYSLNVEDSRGIVIGEYNSSLLIKSTDVIFQFNEPDLLEVQLSATEISCDQGNNGTATVNILGGIPPYNIQWSNGSIETKAVDLIAGNYVVFVTDARGCEVTGNITLMPPGSLQIDVIKKAPSCFKGNDGAIEVSISGGVPPYTHSWNTGETGTSIKNLKEGTYIFTLTDANKCKAFVKVDLEEPEEITIDLGEDKTLCKDQSYVLNATIEDTNTTYLWTSDNGFSSTDAIVEVQKSGVYTIEATSSKGCTITDSITIQYNDEDIESNFLMSSQAYLDEEIVLLNKSSLQQSVFEWILPEDVIIVEKTERTITLKFKEVTSYEIGLRSHVGDCIEELFKTIVIEEPSELADSQGVSESFIELFRISPNPNNGNFTADIKLIKPSEIAIRIFNMQGELIKSYTPVEIVEEYTKPFTINQPSGMYVVVLETAKETRVKRMIVH